MSNVSSLGVDQHRGPTKSEWASIKGTHAGERQRHTALDAVKRTTKARLVAARSPIGRVEGVAAPVGPSVVLFTFSSIQGLRKATSE